MKMLGQGTQMTAHLSHSALLLHGLNILSQVVLGSPRGQTTKSYSFIRDHREGAFNSAVMEMEVEGD